MPRPPSRRDFGARLLGAGALTLSASSWSRVLGANSALRVAAVGVGGRGWSDLAAVTASPHVRVTGLCDIDSSEPHLGRAAKKFPSARTTDDYRKLFDAAGEFDAVMVATPDHMHAPVSIPALQLGKHVLCQKPLTHTVHEARQMRLAAEKAGVVTQMGNQIQSHGFYRTAVSLVRAGAVGKVKEVHSWQAGKIGWLSDGRPAGDDPVPVGVNWDGWLGVAPARPYKAKLYHAFNWRGWQDFGNNMLGDFGCHILDPVFTALQLTAPRTVKSDNAPLPNEVWGRSCVVRYEFPGTPYTAGATLPVTWYDGEGNKPDPEAAGLPRGANLPGAGSLFVGERGVLLLPHVGKPQLLPAEKFADHKHEPVAGTDHFVLWADACRGEAKTASHFGYAGPLTEAVLLGTLAMRFPGRELQWDAAALKVTNAAEANQYVSKPYRQEYEPKWG